MNGTIALGLSATGLTGRSGILKSDLNGSGVEKVEVDLPVTYLLRYLVHHYRVAGGGDDEACACGTRRNGRGVHEARKFRLRNQDESQTSILCG